MVEHRGANEEALSAEAVCPGGNSSAPSPGHCHWAVQHQHSPAEEPMGQHQAATASHSPHCRELPPRKHWKMHALPQ